MAMQAGLGNTEERRARLVQALRTAPDDAACQACLSSLDEYVTAQLAGQDYMARFPDVAMHLDVCLDCAGAYARLYELEIAEAADRLPQPDRVSDPDLSFLLPGAAGPMSPAALRARLRAAMLTDRLRAALRRIGDRLTLQLSVDLLEFMRPAPAMMSVRAPAAGERYAEVVLILEPDETLRPDLPITVTAYRDSQRPDECLVEVVVQPPGRNWPDLDGNTVVLIVAGERREATTDAWGLASFTDISITHLADLTVEVTLTH